MTHSKLLLCCTTLLLLLLASCALAIDPAAYQAVKAAQAYRARGEAVEPGSDGNYFCEGEEFKVVKTGWKAKPWGENYYAATTINTFLSRKAFLGAPEQCKAPAVAVCTADIKEAGRYLVLARYEAVFRFETQFRVVISQDGKDVFNRLYGARDNVKVWYLNQRLAKEGTWPLNGVWESIVWEGHDAYANLHPGPAKITLIAGMQPTPAARRNVDLVMLTRDEAQVKMRIEKESHLPLDGWLTQAGDVYLRATNAGDKPVTVSGGNWQEHSPYWVHIRNWKPISLVVPPGPTSAWTEVGGTMDTLNDGQWRFTTTGACTLTFGVKAAGGKIEPIRTFTDVNGTLALAGQADTRYSRRLFTQQEMTDALMAYLRGLPRRGKAPVLTHIEASGGWPKDDWQQICDLYGFSTSQAHQGPNATMAWGYQSPAQLDENCRKLTEAEQQNVAIVSLGDEIGLPEPDARAATDGFTAFLKAQGVTPDQIDPAAGGDWGKIAYNGDSALRETNPGLYYWSTRYRHEYGIQAMKAQTDVLRKYLPSAGIGANYSPFYPQHYSFLGEVFKWVNVFREDAMTMPWSEDWVFQIPIGTPQMNGINLDLLRAGIRHRPERKIQMYVMPHMPGNNPNTWRRMFFSALGHGTKVFNLFEFDPVWLAYTENYVNGREMYAMVLKTLRELGTYEDIVQGGQVRPAETGLWFSETADIWEDNAGSFGASKRALYIAILNQQVPLDFIVDQDALDGTLDRYKVLYLADRHVSQAASQKIAVWVRNGGRLFATAGAGMFDEYNRPNTVLRELMGVQQTVLEAPGQQVELIKLDLAFVSSSETARWQSSAGPLALPTFCVVNRVTAVADARITGHFADGAPAVIERVAGKGSSTYCAFLPGLTYFKPAIPLWPKDFNSRDDSLTHFLPTAFDPAAGLLVGQPLAGIERPAAASDHLVETSIIESPAGAIIVLDNWRGKAIHGLQVRLTASLPAASISLASGKPVKVSTKAGQKTLVFDLDVAGDVLILR